METIDIFRDRLKKTRESRGLSQSQLAELIGLPPSSISHFENGPRKPSFDNLKKLAGALHVSIDFLLGTSDEQEGVAQVDVLARKVNELPQGGRDAVDAFIQILEQKGLIKKDNT